MATGRTAIFEGIFQTLLADPSLVPSILGARTVQNQRLYRGFPQQMPVLSSYEPAPDGEGWLVLEEPQPGLRAANTQYETAHEVVEVNMHVFSTRYAIADAVIDVLDSVWEWTTEQMRDVVYGDRILLFTRRFQTKEAYAQEVKLFQKVPQYRMEFIRAVLFP